MKRNLMFKRLLTTLLAGVMIGTTLVGCGDKKGAEADANATPKGKIVVGGWPAGDEAFKAALPEFKKKFPDVEVELQFQATGDHTQAFQTALAAGTGAPDVSMVEGASMGKYKDGSGLENLLGAPYNAGELKDDFVAFKWDLGLSVDNERLSGLPWDIGPCTYFYRRDIFEEVGLPSDPESVYKQMATYDGLLEVAEKVSKPGERWLLPNAFYLYTWNFINRDFYNEKLELQLDRPNAKEGLEAAITMRKNGWDAKAVDMWSNEANAGFANGSIVSVATGAWYGGFLKSWVSPDNAGKWGMTKMPCGVEDCNWGGSYLTLPTQSKNKTAAWAFIKYMMADATAQNTMFQAVDYFPAYKPAWEDKAVYEAEDPYFAGQKTKSMWVEISKNIKPVFSTMMDSQTEGAMGTAVNTGLNEGKTADEIIKMVEDQVAAETKEDRENNIELLKDAGVWKD